jgi:hypothetical protein
MFWQAVLAVAAAGDLLLLRRVAVGLDSGRFSGDIVEMVGAASHQNKRGEARFPSQQGHLWRRRRATTLVSS